MYDIQHCFIHRLSDSTLSENAGIEPRSVALIVRRSDHSTKSHPYVEYIFSYIASFLFVPVEALSVSCISRHGEEAASILEMMLTLHGPSPPASCPPITVMQPPILNGENPHMKWCWLSMVPLLQPLVLRLRSCSLQSWMEKIHIWNDVDSPWSLSSSLLSSGYGHAASNPEWRKSTYEMMLTLPGPSPPASCPPVTVMQPPFLNGENEHTET